MIQNSVLDAMSDIIAIEHGFIHPSVMMSEKRGSIDAALESLGPVESVRAKRKFRKFLKQTIKKFGGLSGRGRKSHIRELIYWEIRKMTFDRFFDDDGLPMEGDNYQR